MIDARSDAGEAVPANENSPKKPGIASATIVALAVHYSGQTPSTRRWTCTCRPSSALAALGDYHLKERASSSARPDTEVGGRRPS